MNCVKEDVTEERICPRNSDRRLEMAADALAWAIRWFFHMWVSREHSRWGTYKEWKGYLRAWTTQKAHDSYKHGCPEIDTAFPRHVVEGIIWLVKQWFDIELSNREKKQLERMLEPR